MSSRRISDALRPPPPHLPRPGGATALAATAVAAIALPIALAGPAQAAPRTITGVQLEWTLSAELQKAPPAGGSSYFSAGVSTGDQASYRVGSGNASVLHRLGATSSVPSWTSRASFIAAGANQVVRLNGGTAVVQDDGSAVVSFSGAFSVNMYGGMVPFTVVDPEVIIEADGDGELVADLTGYASSQADPTQKEPLPPASDVTVATFSGVTFNQNGITAVTPHYDGVAVSTPGAVAQNRTVAGWGSWPQEFVNFQLATGLSSYWYSSNGAADPYKKPTTFRLNTAPTSTYLFVDVPAGAQFFTEIGWLATRGVTTGYERADGSREYRPLSPVNRDAMAAFLYRLAGSPAVTLPATSPFVDVPTSNQFYKEIVWLSQRGISTGWDTAAGKEFRPLTSINRDAMAAFLYRFESNPPYTAPATSPFADVPTSNQFYKEISWLAARGISTGWGSAPNREYRPLTAVNRDAMAAFLSRLDAL